MWEVDLPWRWVAPDAIPVHTLGRFFFEDPVLGSYRRGCTAVHLGFCGGLDVDGLLPWPGLGRRLLVGKL